MSGICGYVSNVKITSDEFSDMVNAIDKRGEIILKYKGNDFEFANLVNENCKFDDTKNSDIIVCIDGILDNADELNKIFNKEYTDIDLIRELYKKYGEDFIDKLDGSFVIVLFDKNKNKLLMIRDKMGTKSLYYYIYNDSICFASELKAIMKFKYFKKCINPNSLSMYFRYNYINPPETIFTDTYKLEHGTYVIFEHGTYNKKEYWNIIEKYNSLSSEQIESFEEAKSDLKKKLSDKLKEIIQDKSDVGIYLSGGVDSSLVTALCSKALNKKIKTFSIGFYDKQRNEATKSKKIAEYLGTDHYEKYVSTQDIIETIKKIPQYYDEPFADASELPTIILNEFAKENNLKIALTGCGADQLFCGSVVYDKEYKLFILRSIFNPLNANFSFIKFGKLKYIFNNNKMNEVQFDIYNRDKVINGLFNDCGNKRYDIVEKIKCKNLQIKRMILDLNTFVPNRLNIKMGMVSSNNKINNRSPFLNSNIVEYSFKIPHKFKYFKGNKKYILKEILYEYVPKDLLDSKKMGFGIPMIKWLKEYLYEDIKKISTQEFIEKQGIFNYKKLSKLIENIKNEKSKKGNPSSHLAQVLWNYYMFQLWYEKYM